MTTHIGVVPTREESPVYQTMLEAAREVAQYAAAHGVTLAIETGPEPADRLKKFIENAGGKGIGVNLRNILSIPTQKTVCICVTATRPMFTAPWIPTT